MNMSQPTREELEQARIKQQEESIQASILMTYCDYDIELLGWILDNQDQLKDSTIQLKDSTIFAIHALLAMSED